MYPKQVEINEKNLAKLIQTYKSAYRDIISGIIGATDFGVDNRQKILAQIETTLKELGVNTQEWLEKEIPNYYASGADDVVKQLKNVDAPLTVESGYNQIHKDAITGLVDDTARAFGESMSGVNRAGQLLLGRVARETLTQELATGAISGEALRKVKERIKSVLLEDGLTALVDRGGRGWSLDRYAEMLFRTKMVEARNRGVANRLVENGYDLVQVSYHFKACALCAPWQGKVLSASGYTKGYPTVLDAERAGLFHPNCRHSINAVVPSLANMTEAYNPKTKTLSGAGDSVRSEFEKAIRKIQLTPAEKAQADFKAGMMSVMGNTGGGVANPKGMKSMYRKVVDDYNGDPGKVKDGNRGYLLVNNPWDKKEFEDLKKRVGGVWEIDEKTSKDKLNADTGYAYAMWNVKLPDGRLAEVQVTYPEMWKAKITKGEDLYKKIQFGGDADGKIHNEMMNLYQKAYETALARNGMG